MANNRTFFGNKLTGEFTMIDKHYNDYVQVNDNCMKAIQSIINKTGEMNNRDNQERDGREPNNCPFVFFAEQDDLYEFFTGNHHVGMIARGEVPEYKDKYIGWVK